MRRFTPFALAALAGAPLLAQQPAAPVAKRPIRQDDYDRWRTIAGASLSPDGRWAAWTESPVVGDGELLLRETGGTRRLRIARGWTGRPVTSVQVDSPFVAPAAQFSADSRWLAVTTFAPKADFDRARAARGRQSARTSLVLVALADAGTPQPVTIPRVRSWRFPREAATAIAWLLEPDSAAAPVPRDSAARRAPGDSARRPAPRDFGSTLVVRTLATGAEVRIADVVNYAFSPDGRWLAYTVGSRANQRDGAWLRDVATGTETALATGIGNYRQLVFDRAGRRLAFVSDRDEHLSAARPRASLWLADVGSGQPARRVVAAGEHGDSLRVSERTLGFTRDGGTVVYGVAKVLPDTIPADSLADKAVVDVWHWRDARLQPQQRVEVGRDRERAFTAVHRIAEKRTRVLGNDTIPLVQLSDDGSVGLATTSVPYEQARLWGDDGQDVIVVDPATGATRTVARKVGFGAQLSAAGKYVAWFDDGRWYVHDVKAKATRDLTGSLTGVRFDQETWDTPSEPAPWGIAGWTTGDRALLLHGRFDVWELDPAGKAPARVLTDSLGTRTQTVLRVIDTDDEERAIDPAQPLLLRAFEERTKRSGFMRDRIGAVQPVEPILMEDASWQFVAKAKGAERWLVRRGTFTEFPDLRTGADLARTERISDANPQQREVRWATSRLVSWRSLDGRTLQGLLFVPEGHDGRPLPLVTYFYEQLSDGLHNYTPPTGRNVVNPVVYASQGYAVFFPDIAYETGFPGQSAFKSIIPGIDLLISQGIADSSRLAISGQSWGGYQVAYLVTQTDRFKAAFAGAPVANMTSAYGGIRWESGLARSFQYEKGQSRIGKSIWEAPMRYLDNSPLFQADRIRTPMLIMANDADGAVPWQQGIELFVALKRFGRETYLLNYNGDGHNPRKRANQKDVDRRTLEFLAHHLKGEPAPDWMRRGVPYLEKGRDQFPRVTAAPQPGAPAPGTGASSVAPPR